MKDSNFKVCVRCFTFNQSKYIIETMNGFCNQQTNFPFICCIVDDASTDGEQEVITDYLNEYFDMHNSSVAYKKETDYAHIFYSQHKENKNCYFVVLFLKENHYKKNLNFHILKNGEEIVSMKQYAREMIFGVKTPNYKVKLIIWIMMLK